VALFQRITESNSSIFFYFADYTPEFNSMINRMYVNLIFILFALSNLVLISSSNENRSCVILLSSYRIGIEVQDELMAVMISHIAWTSIPIRYEESKITQDLFSFEEDIKTRFDKANKMKIKFTYILFIIELNSGV
jgi:hypothetical protein